MGKFPIVNCINLNESYDKPRSQRRGALSRALKDYAEFDKPCRLFSVCYATQPRRKANKIVPQIIILLPLDPT